ncbi:hypothetical protein JMA18_19085, partial [Acinetobacter baumannii]|uniref:hypothetical protein n=1 Tax=Acinetobacter baumannii TaxID=470 RepID=UPI001C472181
LYNYLKRCWEASSQEIRSERIYSLLELPIDSQSDLLFNLYNIIYDNKTTIILKTNKTHKDKIHKIINIIVSGLKQTGRPRWEACLRYILISEILTKNQKSLISEYLWKNDILKDEHFPLDKNLFDYNYIISPLIDKDLAIDIFKKRYFKIFENKKDITNFIFEISNSIEVLEITDEDQEIFNINLISWKDIVIKTLDEYDPNEIMYQFYDPTKEFQDIF